MLLILITFLPKCKNDNIISCDTSKCKFKVGQDVVIKNKLLNDNATIVAVNCGCTYDISYYSFVMKQRRTVEEYEIRNTILGF
jgi:hypothetical protein